MKPVVLIHGKPGLGKSTLATSVAAALRAQGTAVACFSIGQRLRSISSGELASRYVDQLAAEHDALYRHAHVNDPVVIHGVVAEFLRSVTEGLVIIDGHPRYMDMVDEYEQTLNECGWYTALVVIIDGSDDLARERMARRHRGEAGMEEDPAWRLDDYSHTMTPVLTWLSSRYPTIHVNANDELYGKVEQVCRAIRNP